MSDDLVKQLRKTTHMYQVDCELKMKCADRIEELEAKLAEADAMIEAQQKDYASNNVRFAEAEHRAKAAEARIAHLENHIEGVAKDTHKIMVDLATPLDDPRVKALVGAVRHEREMVCQDFDMQSAAAQAVDAALSALEENK